MTPSHWPRPRVMPNLSQMARGRGRCPRDFRKLVWFSSALLLEKSVVVQSSFTRFIIESMAFIGSVYMQKYKKESRLKFYLVKCEKNHYQISCTISEWRGPYHKFQSLLKCSNVKEVHPWIQDISALCSKLKNQILVHCKLGGLHCWSIWKCR